MAEQPLFTYEDAVDHLRDVMDIGSQDSTSKRYRAARRAVDQAYRDLPRKHEWAYYERRGLVKTEANQTTGTVAYDHTGGSVERELTLTGATWPTNAARGHVLIENQRYKVATRESPTVVTLSADTNPGEDVASGTEYNWFRSVYPLPVKFRQMSPLVDIKNSRFLEYIPPGRAPEYEVGFFTPQEPTGYTIRNMGDFYGGLSLELLPPPSVERTYHFAGAYEPRQLTTLKENTGTVSITASETTVTGSGTAFADKHVGDVIRFSTSATAPTGLFGNPDDVDNPYTAQRIIMSFTSATSVTVNETVSSSLNGVAYTISSPIDIAPGDMWNYFTRLCEKYYWLHNPKDATRSQRGFLEHDTQRALRLAMKADHQNRDMLPAQLSDRRWYDLADWAIEEAFGGTKIT